MAGSTRNPEEPGWGGAGAGAYTCSDFGPWVGAGAGAGGRLLQRGPATLKVFTQGSEMGGTGFIAVEFETGHEEGVRGTG